MIVSGAKANICDECIESAANIIKQEMGYLEDPVQKGSKKQPNSFQFNYKPIDIKNHLDTYVIGQEDAKKVSLASRTFFFQVQRDLPTRGGRSYGM